MATTTIKYNKQLLIPSFTNRVNQMAKGDDKLMALGSKHISWFNNNIDYTAREIELIMSVVSSASTLYSANDIIYSIGYPKDNETEYLAKTVEKFFIEKMAERFYVQNATDIKKVTDYSLDIYALIKSITLKKSSDNDGKYKRK